MRSNRSKQKELKFSYMCTFFRDDLTKNILKFKNIMQKLINNRWVTFMIIEGHTKVNVRELVNGYPEEKSYKKFLDTDEAKELGINFIQEGYNSEYVSLIPALFYALWVDYELFIGLSKVISEIDQKNNETLELFNSGKILKEIEIDRKYFENINSLYGDKEICDSLEIDMFRLSNLKIELIINNGDLFKCGFMKAFALSDKWTEKGRKALWDLLDKI